MDVFDSKEMRWASCCGVSFCGCNARLCEVSALFSQKKFSRQKKGGGVTISSTELKIRGGGGALLGRAIKNVQIVPRRGTIWDLAVVLACLSNTDIPHGLQPDMRVNQIVNDCSH